MVQNIERRKFIRKRVRMACAFSMSSGMMFYGNTVDVSLQGVCMESPSFSSGSGGPLNPGDSGLLTLRFRIGDKEENMKVRCQVMHVAANGVGLSIRYADLSKKDQDNLGKIIASGKANIEED